MQLGYQFTDKLIDPLSPTTRKARKSLLGVSLVSICIAEIGLIPTRISALGLEFTNANQEALAIILAFVVGYFVLTTLTYLGSEVLAWQIIVRSEDPESEDDSEAPSVDRNDQGSSGSSVRHVTRTRRAAITYAMGRPMFITRLIVESMIPVVIGIYAMVALLSLDIEQFQSEDCSPEGKGNQNVNCAETSSKHKNMGLKSEDAQE